MIFLKIVSIIFILSMAPTFSKEPKLLNLKNMIDVNIPFGDSAIIEQSLKKKNKDFSPSHNILIKLLCKKTARTYKCKSIDISLLK